MSDGFAGLEAHAYVDNCLSPADRDAFQAAMRRDSKLKARVEAWDSQNEAIRIAFGADGRARQTPIVSRPSNQNEAVSKQSATTVRESERPHPGNAGRPKSLGRTLRWRSPVAGALVFILGIVSFGSGAEDPRLLLIRRVEAGLRAAVAFGDTKLDFISDDPRAVAAWLSTRFARVDPHRLNTAGWSLLGVRIVPGVNAAAALVLYEDAIGGRAALLLEPVDALQKRPVIREREGDETLFAGVEGSFAYAAIGPSRSGVSALIPVLQPPP